MLPIDIVKDATIRVSGLDWETLISPSRLSDILMWRKVMIRLLHEAGYGCTEIGCFLNRDHATIIHTLNNTDFDYHYDRIFRTIYDTEMNFIFNNYNQAEQIWQR